MSEFVVVSDLHGRLGHLEAIVNRYKGLQLISAGDVVDGPDYSDVAGTVNLLIEIGAITLLGNHDWTLSATMYEQDKVQREAWATCWQNYELNTLKSYGVDKPKTRINSETLFKADTLVSVIEERGHDKYFKNLRPYFRTSEFIVVHAGLLNTISVQQQCKEMDTLHLADGTFDYSAEPIQIFDDSKYGLSKSDQGLSDSGSPVLITGHFHNRLSPDLRKTDSGKRIRLGSRYGDPNGPVNVWESWSGNVVPVLPKYALV